VRKPTKPRFLIVWEFTAKPEKESLFEAAYDPEGIWVQFFRKGIGYHGTKLLRDTRKIRCYLTLDFWDSRAAYERFRKSHAREYSVIDRECESLMERETLLGMFEGVPAGRRPGKK
jgi:heme-degrading monooxygenase HmoA